MTSLAPYALVETLVNMQPQPPPQFVPLVGEGRSVSFCFVLTCAASITWLKSVAPKLTNDNTARLAREDLDPEAAFYTYATSQELQAALQGLGITLGSARLIAAAHFAKRGVYSLFDTFVMVTVCYSISLDSCVLNACF